MTVESRPDRAETLPLQDVVDAIASVLAPHLGETMARAAVQAHRTKLGLPEGPLDTSQVDALVARLGIGLNIFVGRANAALLEQQMRQVLARLRAGERTSR
jgi:hypothetical protein